MKKVVSAFLLMLIATLSVAQESQTGYNFLRVPVSAHAGALGGDNITLIEDDITLVFHNPALLSTVSDKTINLNYMNYMSGVNMGSAAFNKIIKERATIGVTAQYINYGTMKETDENNVQTGEFTAKDISVAGYFSYLLTDRIAGGIGVKFINAYIADYSSFAVGVDLGLNYYDPDREWSVSIVAKNLGGQIKKFDNVYDKMPIDVQAGVSKRLLHTPFRPHITMIDLNHWDYKFIYHFVAGIDVLLSDNIWIGGGYNFRRANEMEIEGADDDSGDSHGAGISLGAGINLERFKLNLAYGKYHVSSNSFIVNIAYNL